MSHGEEIPDPRRIHSLADLARAFTLLRRRAARKGQVQLSIRDLSRRTGRAPSTLHPYLRGVRLCPADTYESLLRELGVAETDLRPWLDAWERIADSHWAPAASGRRPPKHRPTLLPHSATMLWRLRPKRRRAHMLGIVTGDIRRARNIDVWVNSENTGMTMARFEEYSISAIIRFDGATLDESGHVVDDQIATELADKLAGRTPVPPGTAVVTDAGELTRRYGVRYVIHVAAVYGEPGKGYEQIADVGRCVTNALVQAERLGSNEFPIRTILFPLLGVGTGGGDLEVTVTEMVGAAIDHLASTLDTRLATVWLLASTEDELAICRHVLDADPRLRTV